MLSAASDMSAAQTVKLSSGHSMPVVGLGTWKSKPGEVAAAVKHAIKSGYRWVRLNLIRKLSISGINSFD